MSSENRGDLKELFGAFMGPEEARKAAEDIKSADELLRRYPAPEPSGEVLLRIKARGTAELARRRRMHIWRTYAVTVAAVAAVLVVVGGVCLRLLDSESRPVRIEYLSKAVWEADSIVEADSKLAYISAEIEQVQEQFRSILSPPKQEDTSVNELYEMEMELIAMENDFWKG